MTRFLLLFSLTFGFLGITPSPSVAMQRNQTTETRVEQLLVRGMTKMYLEDFEGAVETFDEALKIRPGDSTLLLSMVKAKMELEEYSSADFFLQQILDANPSLSAAWDLRAALSTTTGNMTSLLESRRRLAELNREDLESQMNLIRLLAQLERSSEAVGVVDAALSQFPNNIELLEQRARLLTILARSSQLQETLLHLVELNPSNLDYRIQLGSLFIREGAWDKAEMEFRAALDQDPENVEVGQSLAAVLDGQGRTEEGLLVLQRIESMATRENVATGLDLTSDERRSAATYDELLSWYGEHSDDNAVVYELASRMKDAGEFVVAAELLSQLIDRAPRELDAWVQAIDAYSLGEVHEAALSTAENGLLLFPGYPPLMVAKSRALVGIGRTDEALELIQKLLAQLSDPDQIEELRGLLAQIEAM